MHKNKRIAVTGASGFIGKNLVKHLLDNNNEVFCLIKDEYKTSELPEKINKIYGDILSKNDVDYFIEKSRPEIFIHLAAQTQAAYSIKYPYSTISTNIVGTLNILESLRNYEECKAVLVASSDKTYGELAGSEYIESHDLNGIYPYDASKSITDILCRSYRLTYGMNVTSIRHCNVYGPGDYNEKRIVPGIVKKYIDGGTFVIRNGGNDVREYIHVYDVISSYNYVINYMLQNSNNGCMFFNIGSKDRLTTKEAFFLIKKHLPGEIKYLIDNNQGQELSRQVMNFDLITTETGWSPQYSFNSSIKDVVQWYLDFFKAR